MPLFFFISGFLAYKEQLSGGGVWGRVWKKAIYLVVPTLIVKSFFDLLNYKNPLSFFIHGLGGYWFGITLFECFFIYYITSSIFKNVRHHMIALIVLSCCGLILLSSLREFGPLLFDMNHLTKYFHFFTMGLLARRYKTYYSVIMASEWAKLISLICFFLLLFTINMPIWPPILFHLLRDIVLRYLGLFIVLSFFVCHENKFAKNNLSNSIMYHIGRSSMAIYLLQYFFLPDYNFMPSWIKEMDHLSLYVIAFVYAVVIMVICLVCISFLSNSEKIRKYVLGQSS